MKCLGLGATSSLISLGICIYNACVCTYYFKCFLPLFFMYMYVLCVDYNALFEFIDYIFALHDLENDLGAILISGGQNNKQLH